MSKFGLKKRSSEYQGTFGDLGKLGNNLYGTLKEYFDAKKKKKTHQSAEGEAELAKKISHAFADSVQKIELESAELDTKPNDQGIFHDFHTKLLEQYPDFSGSVMMPRFEIQNGQIRKDDDGNPIQAVSKGGNPLYDLLEYEEGKIVGGFIGPENHKLGHCTIPKEIRTKIELANKKGPALAPTAPNSLSESPSRATEITSIGADSVAGGDIRNQQVPTGKRVRSISQVIEQGRASELRDWDTQSSAHSSTLADTDSIAPSAFSADSMSEPLLPEDQRSMASSLSPSRLSDSKDGKVNVDGIVYADLDIGPGSAQRPNLESGLQYTSIDLQRTQALAAALQPTGPTDGRQTRHDDAKPQNIPAAAEPAPDIRPASNRPLTTPDWDGFYKAWDAFNVPEPTYVSTAEIAEAKKRQKAKEGASEYLVAINVPATVSEYFPAREVTPAPHVYASLLPPKSPEYGTPSKPEYAKVGGPEPRYVIPAEIVKAKKRQKKELPEYANISTPSKPEYAKVGGPENHYQVPRPVPEYENVQAKAKAIVAEATEHVRNRSNSNPVNSTNELFPDIAPRTQRKRRIGSIDENTLRQLREVPSDSEILPPKEKQLPHKPKKGRKISPPKKAPPYRDEITITLESIDAGNKQRKVEHLGLPRNETGVVESLESYIPKDFTGTVRVPRFTIDQDGKYCEAEFQTVNRKGIPEFDAIVCERGKIVSGLINLDIEGSKSSIPQMCGKIPEGILPPAIPAKSDKFKEELEALRYTTLNPGDVNNPLTRDRYATGHSSALLAEIAQVKESLKKPHQPASSQRRVSEARTRCSII